VNDNEQSSAADDITSAQFSSVISLHWTLKSSLHADASLCTTQESWRDGPFTGHTYDGHCVSVMFTSNLSKAHVTRDSSSPATWAIVYSMQQNNNAS